MDLQTMIVSEHIAISTQLHAHDYYQLIYCKNGVGEIQIDKTVYSARTGYAYLARPMVDHTLTQIDGMHVLEIKFIIENPRFDDELKKIPECFPVHSDTQLRLTLQELAKEGIGNLMYSHEATNAALQLFLVRLLRNYSDNTDIEQQTFYFSLPKGRGNDFDRMNDIDFVQVIEYIEKNLSKPISLDDLVRLVHFNKSYLVERFKSVYGIPPMQYVNWLRIEKAKELLLTTEKSITEIADETGFQSIHYFSRFFKEKENDTPHGYRQKHKVSFLKNNEANQNNDL